MSLQAGCVQLCTAAGWTSSSLFTRPRPPSLLFHSALSSISHWAPTWSQTPCHLFHLAPNFFWPEAYAAFTYFKFCKCIHSALLTWRAGCVAQNYFELFVQFLPILGLIQRQSWAWSWFTNFLPKYLRVSLCLTHSRPCHVNRACSLSVSLAVLLRERFKKKFQKKTNKC